MMQRSDLALALLLIAAGIALRFAPHPANFAPIGALALFAGVVLPRRYAFAVPLAAMIVSDALLGFHSVIAYTWGSFALIGAIGWLVRRRPSAPHVVTGSLAGSVLFFLITNFGVWLHTGLYAKTWGGLVQSYTLALPFFRNTLAGDLFYTAVLFGLYAAARAVVARSLHRSMSITYGNTKT